MLVKFFWKLYINFKRTYKFVTYVKEKSKSLKAFYKSFRCALNISRTNVLQDMAVVRECFYSKSQMCFVWPCILALCFMLPFTLREPLRLLQRCLLSQKRPFTERWTVGWWRFCCSCYCFCCCSFPLRHPLPWCSTYCCYCGVLVLLLLLLLLVVLLLMLLLLLLLLVQELFGLIMSESVYLQLMLWTDVRASCSLLNDWLTKRNTGTLPIK